MSANQDNTNLQAFIAPANRRRRVLLTLLGGVIVLAAVGYGSYYYLHGRWFEETDDAYANGNVVQVSPQIAGTVVTIGADDNALVHAGQSLAALDPTDASVALEQAEANLARTVRQVRGLYTNVGSQEADLAARRAALERARADFDR
ncbi:MAG: biotin/lipoyl-binding protein [Rhodocyclaceae bacterium]